MYKRFENIIDQGNEIKKSTKSITKHREPIQNIVNMNMTQTVITIMASMKICPKYALICFLLLYCKGNVFL